MKILVISSHYPPFHSGGYEIRIKNIMDDLSERGHEIYVITSTKNKKGKDSDIKSNYLISRELHEKSMKMSLIDKMTTHPIMHSIGLIMTAVREISNDIKDLQAIDQVKTRFCPDVIYLGHILPLTRTLLPFLADCETPIILDDGGGTLYLSHQNKGIWFRFIEGDTDKFSILNVIKPQLTKMVGLISGKSIKAHWDLPEKLQILFKRKANLETVKNAGLPIDNAVVLHSGVDTKLFEFSRREIINSPLTIIYPARVEPRKGQMDAVKLLVKLVEKGIVTNLILVGKIRKSFFNELGKEIKDSGVENYVSILPMVPQDELVSLFHKADICFFPSYQEEGLSRVPLEAMACGCIVISYGNEGSFEIIRDSENGFLVDPEDFTSIIAIIKELISKPDKVVRITLQARKDIENQYSLHEYVDQIEKIVINFAEAH